MRTWKGVVIFCFGILSLAVLPARAADATQNSKTSLGDQLCQACSNGDLAKVKALVDQGAPLNVRSGKQGSTPLISALGNLELMKYLVDKGENIDQPDVEGGSPLIYACWQDKTDCALYLIDAGANPNLGNNWAVTPLMCAAQKGNDQVVTDLLAHHANVNLNSVDGPALWWAASANNVSTLKLLIAAGADLTLKPSPGKADEILLPLLGYPAKFGDVDMIDLLLSHGVDVNMTSSDGTTALLVAADHDELEAASELLSKGAKVDLQDSDGVSALIRAAIHSGPPLLKELLAFHAQINLKDKWGRTALIAACEKDNKDAVRYLIDAGADINLTDAAGETALTRAGNVGEDDLVDLLKSKGAERTNVRIIVSNEPVEQITPAQAWAMALGAIYKQRDALNLKSLGGGKPGSIAQATLRSSWKITDRASFLKQFHDLVTTGHRTGYQRSGAKLAQMSEDEFDLVLVKNGVNAAAIKVVRASYLKWKDKSGLAWDLCRAVMLLNEGFVSHYINEKEAWDMMMPVARDVQKSFSSWQEMNDNFLDGREIWARQRDPCFESCGQLLLHDPNSPWTQLPWNTDLGSDGGSSSPAPGN